MSVFPAGAGMNRRFRRRPWQLAGVFPAGAGMNRLAAIARAGSHRCVPRRRGDEPLWRAVIRFACQVFPAGAGMNRHWMAQNTTRNVFPAGAGMNRPFNAAPSQPGVPRRRGDEPSSAPPMRSSHVVFPAGAGMNRVHDADAQQLTCVPRRRGDEPYAIIHGWSRQATCSPQARG